MTVKDKQVPCRDAGVLRLESFLPYQLNVVTQAVSQGLADLYSAEFGISVPEWRILAALGEQRLSHEQDWQGMTARDLARHSRMGKVMVSRAAASLLARRMIVRRANRDDRRESFLKLTAKGENVYGAIVPRARAFQERLQEGLSDSDAHTFERVMQHLLERAEAADAAFADGRKP